MRAWHDGHHGRFPQAFYSGFLFRLFVGSRKYREKVRPIIRPALREGRGVCRLRSWTRATLGPGFVGRAVISHATKSVAEAPRSCLRPNQRDLDEAHEARKRIVGAPSGPAFVKLASVQAVVRELDAARVRFLIAGGVAVNAHGYQRFTKDLDLVIQLTPENIRAAFGAFARLGYQPQVPITVEQFADGELRDTLTREKGMQVLQLWSDQHRETPIDVFTSEPFPFDEEFARATVKDLGELGPVRIVSLASLIEMKERAGRLEDQLDLQYLRMRRADQ